MGEIAEGSQTYNKAISIRIAISVPEGGLESLTKIVRFVGLTSVVFIDMELAWKHGTENPHRGRTRCRVHEDVEQMESGGVGVLWVGTPDSVRRLRRELHICGRYCGVFRGGLLTAGSDDVLFFRGHLLSNNIA